MHLIKKKNIKRYARGCLLGQLAGDSLGSLVEFKTPEQIKKLYPGSVRELADGGTWNTIAGQPTDDSEMALLLARMLIKEKAYYPDSALNAYKFWLNSKPFDCGMTVSSGLRGNPNFESQANGALMRISPLGIFGVNHDLKMLSKWAMEDAQLTHPHIICKQINALFVMAIAYAIKEKVTPKSLFIKMIQWGEDLNISDTILTTMKESPHNKPKDYVSQQGWVIIAFKNALYQLMNAKNLEDGVIDTVMQGGDTDTNAAICGALLGAVYGEDAIPKQWKHSILSCKPVKGKTGVYQPRPECFWPVDAIVLADKLCKS